MPWIDACAAVDIEAAGIFDFTNGNVETPPACENLNTCSARVESGRVRVEI
jgi:3-phenylpropionate/trans-cinnamate dioxygenase ferredoxin subunit